jgi:glutamate/tyrosine decarboxylase-like PLP-dependent enzyme
MSDDRDKLIAHVASTIADYRDSMPEHVVAPAVDLDELRAAFGAPLGDSPRPAAEVIDDLIGAAAPGLVATTGPRYFGFVIGGSTDAALAADLLTVGWDQCAFNAMLSPAAAVAEEVVGAWLLDLLDLPPASSFALVTGGQAANTVGLAVARHHVLAQAGHDVERDGLAGAPRVRVIAGAERHATIDRALRLIGFGSAVVEVVAADAQGRMDVDAFTETLHAEPLGPTIVCTQAGNVNTGACDDIAAICAAAHERGAWVHVDGAFGLWASASSKTRGLVRGVDAADSWACDAHKWLNVPYDCGFVASAHPESHAAAMSFTAAYLVRQPEGTVRQESDFNPESSRRARGFAVWAALQSLGRQGVADLVDHCCSMAQRFADQLAAVDGVEICNDVVLNQVLVRFGDDERTARVIAGVQADGTCWLGGTTWHGMHLMRISVSNWSTSEEDVDRSAAAILRVAAEV